jgi:hypothetical protein
MVLVLFRAMSPGIFKPDAYELAQASFTGANLLNTDEVAALSHRPLIVKLVIGNPMQVNSSSDTLFMEAGRLLDKANLKAIHNHRGPVLLVSDDPAISAKAWMILSQMGCHELFILTEKDSSEVLKYKFRPDSAAGI